jgi:hypothetical protein
MLPTKLNELNKKGAINGIVTYPALLGPVKRKGVTEREF